MEAENGLLPPEMTDRLVTLCRTAIGDNLRSVTYFTRDDYDQLYLRSDLARDADLATFVGYEWRDFKTTRDAYVDSELGDYRYTVRAFDNGYLTRVTVGDHGVFVTTDGLTIRRSEEVAETLASLLDRS
jgi:hypothetical protein